VSTSFQVPPPGEPPQYSPLPERVRRPLLTTVLWRWRYEVLLFLGISICGWYGYRTGTGVLMLLGAAVVGVSVAAIPPLRRAVSAPVLCVVTAHRVRTGLAQAWVHNRSGRLPALLWTRPTPYGEAVMLWCPAGVCERHVEAAAAILRSACWARHITVTANARHRQLVTVHVVRRPVSFPPGAELAPWSDAGDDMQHG